MEKKTKTMDYIHMKKKTETMDYIQAREELRQWAVKWTGCGIQEGRDGKPYPCGTCFCALLGCIGLNPRKKEYHEHNKPVDRTNEVWRAILQIRDAK